MTAGRGCSSCSTLPARRHRAACASSAAHPSPPLLLLLLLLLLLPLLRRAARPVSPPQATPAPHYRPRPPLSACGSPRGLARRGHHLLASFLSTAASWRLWLLLPPSSGPCYSSCPPSRTPFLAPSILRSVLHLALLALRHLALHLHLYSPAACCQPPMPASNGESSQSRVWLVRKCACIRQTHALTYARPSPLLLLLPPHCAPPCPLPICRQCACHLLLPTGTNWESWKERSSSMQHRLNRPFSGQPCSTA